MKECPVCGARCFDDMEVCYGCLHDFSREDTSPIGQVVSSSCDQEIEEAVMPSGDRRSVVPRFAESPTQVSGRARQSGGSVARVEQARSPQRQTHIVVPLEGSGEPPRDFSGVSIGHKFGGSASSMKAAVSFHPSSCFVLIGPFIPAD